jgi:hypothetical protein
MVQHSLLTNVTLCHFGRDSYTTCFIQEFKRLPFFSHSNLSKRGVRGIVEVVQGDLEVCINPVRVESDVCVPFNLADEKYFCCCS